MKLPLFLNAVFPGARLVRAMQEGHADLAKASNKGHHLIAPNSTHVTIAQDAMVVDAIRQIVEMVR